MFKPEQIICAKCNKPVDKVSWFEDILTGKIEIKVTCHNQVDFMALNSFELTHEIADQLKTAIGFAFENKNIKQ